MLVLLLFIESVFFYFRAGQTARQAGPVYGGRSVSASSSVGIDSSGQGYYDNSASVSKWMYHVNKFQKYILISCNAISIIILIFNLFVMDGIVGNKSSLCYNFFIET